MDPRQAPRITNAIPPPIAPPRGLVGLFDEYDPNEILDVSQFASAQVFLNVYDLGDSDTLRKINAISTANNNVLLGGLFHVGVEVYGGEWCYGYTEDERSGVSCIQPRSHQQHTYRTTVPMGQTRLTPQEVSDLMARLSQEWKGNQYSLIHNNCQNFCNALLKDLHVGRMPGWIDRAARTASVIDTTTRSATEQAWQTAELVRSVSVQVEESVRSILPQDEDHVQRLAVDAVENVRRGSLQAVETVQSESAKLAELALVRSQEIAEAAKAQAEAAKAHAEELSSVVHACASELLGGSLEEQAQEVTIQAQENMRAIGSGLWQFSQDLQKAASWNFGDLFGLVPSAPLPRSSADAHGRASRQSSVHRCPQPQASVQHATRTNPSPEAHIEREMQPLGEDSPLNACRAEVPAPMVMTDLLSSESTMIRGEEEGARPPTVHNKATALPEPAKPMIDLLGDLEPEAGEATNKSASSLESIDLLGDPILSISPVQCTQSAVEHEAQE